MMFISKPPHAIRPVGVDLIEIAIEPGFDFLSHEYRSLQERSQATAFQEGGWLDAIHRQIAPAMAAELVTVTARVKPSGKLIFVLPLTRRRRGGLTVLEFADFGLCDYLSPVYDPADAPFLLAESTLSRRLQRLLPPCDIISLAKMRSDNPVLERLFPNTRRARMRVSAYPVAIGKNWNDWRAARLRPSLRSELDLKRRRLTRRSEPVFLLIEQESEIIRAFDALRSFRADRFSERGTRDLIENQAIFSFYRQIAINGARAGTARTYCLYLSGEPAAVMFGLVHRRTFSLLLVGFDLVRYRRLSVGLLAIEDTIRASIEAGDAIYDFTIGDYRYKQQFGAQPVSLHEWHAAQTIRGYLALLGIQIVRETKRALKPIIKGELRSQRD
jgi:CelD/BcsL family acetyltransferase involved in cellulose biosynthesis